METAVLGIDIAKSSFDVVLLLAGKQFHRSFANRAEGFEQLSLWLQRQGVERVHACLEATGRYGEALAQSLYERKHLVSVINPAQIRDYARSKLTRNKTDKLDARIIALFCLKEQPALWTPMVPEVQELQALVRHLEALQDMRTQENNRLKSVNPSVVVQTMLEAHLQFLEQQIQDVQKRIEEHIHRHPGLKQQQDLLLSIPGIGKKTAAKLLGENIQSFSDGRHLAAFAGLNPSQSSSGSSVRKRTKLSQIGRSGLRKALYFPAISAMRFNPLIRTFCDRLADKHKQGMIIIAAAMRKLLCLALGVLKSGQPFDPHYDHLKLAHP
jgi:transposase